MLRHAVEEKMGSFTVNTIFDLFKERKALVNPGRGGFRFDRRERIEYVFPDQLCEEIASRSASYYSWFLNMDKQAVPVRDLLRRLFEQDTYVIVRQTVEKCGRLLKEDVSPAGIDRIIWEELLDMAGREIPVFVSGSEGAQQMQHMAEAAPSRALAVLFLAAGMDGMTPSQFEKLGSCWRLMNHMFLSNDPENKASREEPLYRLQAGELLLLDGNRREALRQFEQAADKLRNELSSSGQKAEDDDKKRALLGKLLLQIGQLYLYDVEDYGIDLKEDDREDQTACRSIETAQNCLEESAALGCVRANEPLAILMIKNKQYAKAKSVLLRGAQAGLVVCLRILGNAYYRGDEISEGVRDLRQSVLYYLQGACPEAPSSGDSVCQYMLGRILEEGSAELLEGTADKSAVILKENPDDSEVKPEEKISVLLRGRKSEPDYWYAAAARLGNEDAAACLNRLRWHSGEKTAVMEGRKSPHTVSVPAGSRICLLNSRSEPCMQLAGTLPENQYSIWVCRDGSREQFETDKNENIFSGKTVRGETVSGETIKVSEGTLAGTLYGIGMQYLEEAEIMCSRGGSDPAQWLWENFPEILCLAMDADEQRNIRDGLQVLETVYLLHEKSSAFAEKPSHAALDEKTLQKSQRDWTDRLFYLLSDRVKLYVLGSGDQAAPVFDSACSRLGDFYIPLYLCDPAKMASAWILDRLPLFIPALQKQGKEYLYLSDYGSKPMDIAVFGDHPGIVQLCKDIIAAAQIEDTERFPFSLTVVSECADLLEEHFASDCPGIMDPPPGTAVSAPVFIRVKPESRMFQKLMAGHPVQVSSSEEETAAERLRNSRYLIVYTKEANRNLSLAMYLREWYLKTDPGFMSLPFIAAFCDNELTAAQMRTLTAGAEEAGFSWYNNYGIEPFGTPEQLYSYDNLVGSRLEQYALASHFSYYAFSAEEDRFRAEHDYYSRYYNRESSILNALSLSYRLFSAGIAFSDWHDYAEGVSREILGREFAQYLEEGTEGNIPEKDNPEGNDSDKDVTTEESRNRRLEKLSMYEHGRWNRSMLTRGWMPASMEQMLAYIQRGNSRHQLYIAKLHPFICSWDQLGQAGEFPTGIQREYNAIMRQVRADREPADIREIDRENVRKTAQILLSRL